MVYMAGDNDLSMAVDRDLSEMRRVGSTSSLNLLVEFDRAGPHPSRRMRLEKDGRNEAGTDLGEIDSGDPETLLEFIKWGVSKFPADYFCLVLWNHGGGWAPSEVDRLSQESSVPPQEARQLVERSSRSGSRTFFRTTLKRIFSLGSPVERAICADNASGHSLDTLELGHVLAEANNFLGRPLDIVGMDACLMGSIEVAYQLRKLVSVLVTSQDLVPEDGWPYQPILGRLAMSPDIKPQELASLISESFLESYQIREYPGELTMAAFNLCRLQELLDPLESLAIDLLARMPAFAPEIWASQRRSISFLNQTLWDIQTFGNRLVETQPVESVVRSVEQIQRALNPGSSSLVISRAHAGRQAGQCGGLSAYLLPPIKPLSPFYAELDFARDFHWNTFLEAYHSAGGQRI